ncbi:MAG: hypothetical protein DWQ34_21490 [Planctomycetota bacterium]|nr:MAG: hypothetical protein DWQ29_11140 [Planctomycetota bacterium]REJ88838.1 MAG: hypothetical protein DWQ34_21490 [Planctomycetota bacterium]REK29458.1 MAG: hypothetical protein DWQ41_04065 [Planctomycetota bacterium]REK31823.1 MAG: hypothetical protein DWQ45_18315 [Planctomycetota bacterium]
MRYASRTIVAALLLIPGAFSLAAVAAENEPASASEKHLLRYKLKPGDVLEYAVEKDSTIDVQVGDAAGTVRHSSNSGKQYRVLSVDGSGRAELEVQIKFVVLKAENNGQKFEWDSRSEEPPPDAFKGVQETIGSPLGTVKVSPSGEIADLSLPERTGEQPGDTQWEVFPMLPQEPVAVGETWKEAFEIQIQATPTLKKGVKMQRMYTLKSVEDGRATIDVRTLVLSPIRDPMEEGQLIQRTPHGTLVLDINEGRLLERDLKIDSRVVGFQGPQTSLGVVGTRRESLSSTESAVVSGDSKTQQRQRR